MLDYEAFMKGLGKYAPQQSGALIGPAYGADQADPHNPQAMINAAMTGDANVPLGQGLRQTPMVQQGSGGSPVVGVMSPSLGGNSPFAQAGGDQQFGRLQGGLSGMPNSQVEGMINHYMRGATAAPAVQQLGSWDQTQAANWLQMAGWWNDGSNRDTRFQGNTDEQWKAQNWKQFGLNMTPPPPDPNAPPGYQVGRNQNYIGQQQRAWHDFFANETARRQWKGGNVISTDGSPLPVDEQGRYILEKNGNMPPEGQVPSPEMRTAIHGKTGEQLSWIPNLVEAPTSISDAVNRGLDSNLASPQNRGMMIDINAPGTDHMYTGQVAPGWQVKEYPNGQLSSEPIREGGQQYGTPANYEGTGGSTSGGGSGLMAALRSANGLEAPASAPSAPAPPQQGQPQQRGQQGGPVSGGGYGGY